MLLKAGKRIGLASVIMSYCNDIQERGKVRGEPWSSSAGNQEPVSDENGEDLKPVMEKTKALSEMRKAKRCDDLRSRAGRMWEDLKALKNRSE